MVHPSKARRAAGSSRWARQRPLLAQRARQRPYIVPDHINVSGGVAVFGRQAVRIQRAADLGAGPFTRFRRIVLPLSRDGIVSGCSLVFLTCIGVFATPMLLGGPTTVLFPETISGFFHGASDKWPVGSAFALIMLVTALIAAGTFMRLVGGSKRSAI